MQRSTFLRLTAVAAAAMALPLGASAQQVINLTVASSHPTTIPWVGFIPQVFMPEVDKRLAAGGKYKVQWKEAFGGQLYKANATLTSVEQGITDIGWVFSYLEPAKMPISQLSVHTPFVTSDTRIVLGAMNELIDKNPAFRNEWDKYNLVFLGATGSDTYDIYTKFPVKSIDDLKGRKISAPGILGQWLRGVGATPVDGALTTYYTDIQTGVSEGAMSFFVGILPTRVYEVAKYVTKCDVGAMYVGGIAANKQRHDRWPAAFQKAVAEAGKVTTQRHVQDVAARIDAAEKEMVSKGSIITTLADAERKRWIAGLPNIAKTWADTSGPAARDVLKAYFAAIRAAGGTPGRDWDKDAAS